MIKILKWKPWQYTIHGTWTRHLDRGYLYEENWVHILDSQKDKSAIILWHGDELIELSHYYNNNFAFKAEDKNLLKDELDRFLSKVETLKIFA
jgi:hypothetical protein